MSQEKLSAKSKAEVRAMLLSLGVSEKKLDTMDFELSTTCMKGQFTNELSGNEYSGNKYAEIVCFDYETGTQKVGTVAVNRLFDSRISMIDGKPETRLLGEGFANATEYVKSSAGRKAENFGKHMLKTVKVNDLSRFGKSESEQLGNVFGRRFTAVKIPCQVVKQFTEVDGVNPLINTNVELVKNNRANKDLLVFTIE